MIINNDEEEHVLIEFQQTDIQKMPGRAPETWGGFYVYRRAGRQWCF